MEKVGVGDPDDGVGGRASDAANRSTGVNMMIRLSDDAMHMYFTIV